ncbi:MAG: hypothetical protein IJQ60_02800 [Prevotella sp.]|jgi:hypothetical protein|nr:hypothetical protein [Prevotella sp.]
MEKIKNKTKWVRSLKEGTAKTGTVGDVKELKSMSVVISRFNEYEAAERGFMIGSKRNLEQKMITIFSIPLCYSNG